MSVGPIFIDRLPSAAAIQGKCLGLQVAGLKTQGGVAKVRRPGFESLHHLVAKTLTASGRTDVDAFDLTDGRGRTGYGFIEGLQPTARDGSAIRVAEQHPGDSRIQGLGCFVNPGIDGHHFPDEFGSQLLDAWVVGARWNPFDHASIVVAVVSDRSTGSRSGFGLAY